MIGKYRTILRHPTLWRRESAIYDLVKKSKAGVAVETGVNGGLSTSCILAALNAQGHLYSVDMRDEKRLRGRETGWLVPKMLREKWTLVMGDSKTVLPKVLEGKTVDFFHQEASWDYNDIIAELKIVWPYVRSGGILTTPYAEFNSAFQDFCLDRYMEFNRLHDGMAFGIKR